MGCTYSRTGLENVNPKVFQVWNVDGDGRNVKPGRIEITESQLVLYQKGDLTVRWPLRSLRRYGFDHELFSFECGRRCPTGPGVYAFRCAGAEGLFNILQERIQSSTANAGAGNISIAAIEDRSTFSSVITPESNVNNNVRQTTMTTSSPAVDSEGYLEPITASSLSRATFSTNLSRSENSRSSAGFVCIHAGEQSSQWLTESESQSLRNSSSCCNFGSCRRMNVGNTPHYVNETFPLPLSSATTTCSTPDYVNASVATSHPQSILNCQHHTKNTYVNSSALGLSPGHLSRNYCCCKYNSHCLYCVDANTNYAKLDDLLKQEQSAKRQKEQSEHFYVNIKPEVHSKECHSRNASMPNSHFYTNLPAPSLETTKESKTSEESFQVNYAVLDLDKLNKGDIIGQSKSNSEGGAISNMNSPLKSPDGYAQIDFDKTVALSHSTIPCPQNDESIRKTRHNAVIPCSTTLS